MPGHHAVEWGECGPGMSPHAARLPDPQGQAMAEQTPPAARFPTAEALVEAIDEAQLAAPEIPLPIRLFAQEVAPDTDDRGMSGAIARRLQTRFELIAARQIPGDALKHRPRLQRRQIFCGGAITVAQAQPVDLGI